MLNQKAGGWFASLTLVAIVLFACFLPACASAGHPTYTYNNSDCNGTATDPINVVFLNFTTDALADYQFIHWINWHGVGGSAQYAHVQYYCEDQGPSLGREFGAGGYQKAHTRLFPDDSGGGFGSATEANYGDLHRERKVDCGSGHRNRDAVYVRFGGMSGFDWEMNHFAHVLARKDQPVSIKRAEQPTQTVFKQCYHPTVPVQWHGMYAIVRRY